MPEDALSRWIRLISPHHKLAFISAIVIGLFSNMVIFTNSWPNHDGLMNLYDAQMNFEMGRYFLFLFSGISSNFDLNWINGALSIFYLALTAAVLTEMFQLKKKISIVLTAGLIVTFPAITSTFSYMFTADAYMAASLVTTLSLLLTVKFKFGFLPGALFFYLGVGVYQANLPFLMTLISLLFIKEILFNRSSLMTLLQLMLRTALLVGSGMAMYTLSFLIYRSFSESTTSNYQGFGEVGNNSDGIGNPLMNIISSTMEFFFRGFYTEMPVNFFEVMNAAIFMLIGIGFILALKQNRFYLNKPLISAAVVLMLSLPFISFSLYFISPSLNYHLLMTLGLISIYLLPILLYDNLAGPLKEVVAVSWSIVLVSFLLIFNFALIANIAYLNQQLKFERAQAHTNRIIMSIESYPDYQPNVKIAVLGRANLSPEISEEIIPSHIPEMTGPLYRNLLREPHHYKAMMTTYFGVSYEFAGPEEIGAIRGTEEFQSMPTWPDTGSLQMIDEVLVIKVN